MRLCKIGTSFLSVAGAFVDVLVMFATNHFRRLSGDDSVSNSARICSRQSHQFHHRAGYVICHMCFRDVIFLLSMFLSKGYTYIKLASKVLQKVRIQIHVHGLLMQILVYIYQQTPPEQYSVHV